MTVSEPTEPEIALRVRVAVVPSALTEKMTVPADRLTLLTPPTTSVTTRPTSFGLKHGVGDTQVKVAAGMLFTLAVLGGFAVRLTTTERVLNTVTVTPVADAALSALRERVATVPAPLTPVIVVPAPRNP